MGRSCVCTGYDLPKAGAMLAGKEHQMVSTRNTETRRVYFPLTCPVDVYNLTDIRAADRLNSEAPFILRELDTSILTTNSSIGPLTCRNKGVEIHFIMYVVIKHTPSNRVDSLSLRSQCSSKFEGLS